MRWSACELHRRQSGGGKQYQTKFGHDDPSPWRSLGKNRGSSLGNRRSPCRTGEQICDQRISVRPDCGGLQRLACFYFRGRNVQVRGCSLRIQTVVSNPMSHCYLRHIGRGRGRAWILRSSHRQFVGHLARQFLRRWRCAGLTHRRRHLGPWISRRAFLRRLRGAARLDRWILLRIDRHLMLFFRSYSEQQRRCGRKVPSRAALYQHQQAVAAGLSGLGVAARAHVGNAVVLPFVARQVFDHHRARPQ